MTPLDAGVAAIATGAIVVAVGAVGFAATLYNLAIALEIELEDMRRANEALLFPEKPGGRWISGTQEIPPG